MVAWRGIDEVHPKVERAADRGDRLLPVPAGPGDKQPAQAQLADVEVGSSQLSVVHRAHFFDKRWQSSIR
jgi:hypothetical protein